MEGNSFLVFPIPTLSRLFIMMIHKKNVIAAPASPNQLTSCVGCATEQSALLCSLFCTSSVSTRALMEVNEDAFTLFCFFFPYFLARLASPTTNPPSCPRPPSPLGVVLLINCFVINDVAVFFRLFTRRSLAYLLEVIFHFTSSLPSEKPKLRNFTKSFGRITSSRSEIIN